VMIPGRHKPPQATSRPESVGRSWSPTPDRVAGAREQLDLRCAASIPYCGWRT
jgi:hypothetical protein